MALENNKRLRRPFRFYDSTNLIGGVEKKPLDLEEGKGVGKKRKLEFETAHGVTAMGGLGSFAENETALTESVGHGQTG